MEPLSSGCGAYDASEKNLTTKLFRILLTAFQFGILALTAVFAFSWRYYPDAPIFFYVS
jgi:hypothetical protein